MPTEDAQPKDCFPTTASTWIGLKLIEGDEGRAEVNRHIMTVYAWPLEVYSRGFADPAVGEPAEVVQGFFAERLERRDFLASWQASGLRLRRWLMNGFCYYIQELYRSKKKESRWKDLPEEIPANGPSPAEILDRAFVISTIRCALHRAGELCEAEGLAPHWRVFLGHFYNGLPYGNLVGDLGVNPARAAVMARTAARRFQEALREILLRDGVAQEDLDGEIQTLLEVIAA
jgi:hypothetical protein